MIQGIEHWTTKSGIRLFMWRKAAPAAASARGTVLFVHGSALALIQEQDLFVSWLAVGEPDEMPKLCGTGAKGPESECTPA